MCDKSKWVKESIWIWLFQLHLYPTKAEALFKAIIITITLLGSGIRIGIDEVPLLSNENVIPFYMLSLAFIMEYIIRLITVKNIVSKIFPFAIIALNIVVFLISTFVLLNNELAEVGYNHLLWAIIISMIIIWFDVIIMLLIEPPKVFCVENDLKGLGNIHI